MIEKNKEVIKELEGQAEEAKKNLEWHIKQGRALRLSKTKRGSKISSLQAELHKARRELQQERDTASKEGRNHANEKRNYANALAGLQVKLDESEKSRNTIVMANARSAAGVEHDYNCPFTPPSELVKNIKQLADTFFADWLDEADESKGTWMQDDLDRRSAAHIMKQVLIATVRQCHLLVQITTQRSLQSLSKFSGGGGCCEDATDGTDKPTFIKNLEVNAFQQAHKYLFAEFFPAQQMHSVLVDEVLANVLRASDAKDRSIWRSLLHAKAPWGSLSALIVAVLQRFLECELTRPNPLRFVDCFGKVETWEDGVHSKHSVDSWYKYKIGGKFSSSEKVQVLLPPLHQADGKGTIASNSVLTESVVFGIGS